MLNRIRDAVWTILVGRPYSTARLEAQIRVSRELIEEMRATLDNLNAWAARVAKRESREARAALAAATQAPPPQTELQLPPSITERKAALRRRIAEKRGIRRVSGDNVPWEYSDPPWPPGAQPEAESADSGEEEDV